MLTKLIAWLKIQFRKGWTRGWYFQDYKESGYNGDIKRDGNELYMVSNTHPDVKGYKARKCEITREVKKIKRFDFDFTVFGFTKKEGLYTIIQQFWAVELAPVCYLTLQRKGGQLRLYMQNKVFDDTDRGYTVHTYHTFILDENSRTSIRMDFSRDGFRVECNGEDSGWQETPFVNYDKCWIKAGMYWAWKDDKKSDYSMTIHNAKVS